MMFVLRFYSPVNPTRSCRAWSVLLGRLSHLKFLTSIVPILSPQTDNCTLNQWKGENDHRKYFMINLNKRMLMTQRGIKPATSWLPVRCTSNRATEASCRSRSKTSKIIYLKSRRCAWNIGFQCNQINISYTLFYRYIRSKTGVQHSVISSYRFEPYWAASNSRTVQWAWTSVCENHWAEYIIIN